MADIAELRLPREFHHVLEGGWQVVLTHFCEGVLPIGLMAFRLDVGVEVLVRPRIGVSARVVDPEVEAGVSEAIGNGVLCSVAADRRRGRAETWLEKHYRTLFRAALCRSLWSADPMHGVDVAVFGSVHVNLKRVTKVSDHLVESLCLAAEASWATFIEHGLISNITGIA